MSKADKIEKGIMTFAKVGAIGAVVLYFLGKHKREKSVGAVQRIKRRIYKEVSLAQDAGVDFAKKFSDLTNPEISALETTGQNAGWKQSKRSIESGKSYAEAYFNSLRRAWNAVSGVEGIGRAYDVKDADGNVCLTWIEAATEHIEQEPDSHVLLALPPYIEEKKKEKKLTKKEAELKERFNFAYDFVKAYIENKDSNWAIVNTLKQEFKDGSGIFADDVIWSWAHKKFKVSKEWNGYYGKQGEVTLIHEADGKEYPVTLWSAREIFILLNNAWKERQNDKGWQENNDQLDDIRLALLDKAKLMQVEIPYAVAAADDLKNEKGIVQTVVRGEQREDYLQYINWIVIARQHFDVADDTYYPVSSFDTKFEAETFAKSKGRGYSVKPIWDVDIKSITGIF